MLRVERTWQAIRTTCHRYKHTLQRSFTQQDVDSFTGLTGDSNPIHSGSKAIVPGLLAASLFPAIIGSAYPGVLYASQKLNFRQAVPVSTLLTATVEATRTSRGVTRWQTLVQLPDGAVAVEGTAVSFVQKASGIAADSGHRAVRVVSDSQAAEAKQGFSEVLSEQIYSLTPSVGAPDASSLIAGDVEQARQMMTALLANKKPESGSKVEAFMQNGCSMVKGVPCVREVIKRTPKPAPETAPAQAKKPPLASTSGQLKSKAGSASAEKSGKQEPSVKAEPGKATKGKANNPLANSFSKSAGKKPAKVQVSKGDAKAEESSEEPQDVPMAGQDSDDDLPSAQNDSKQKKESQQVLDDDEEDEESPLPTKQRGAKARQHVLEDSDDDFAPDPMEKKALEPARKPLQAASKQQAAAVSKKASAKAAKDTKMKGGDSDMENAETDKTEPEAATKAVESAKGDAQGSHSEYGAPPHPDAEIAMIGSKVVWQFINDKGEEVTVEVKKPEAAAKPAAVKQQVPSKRAKPEPQEDGAPAAADEPKAVKKKKPTTKHQKAAVQASDIRNLFGKK